MGIKKITFEEALPLWKELWYPKQDIQKRSGRKLLYGFDPSVILNDDIEVTYFGFMIYNKIVAVNSGYQYDGFRSRGLYVLPEFRNRGFAQELLESTIDEARKLNMTYIWSMPRKSALPVYKKCGFKVLSKFFEGEYGENCFVWQVIK